MSEIKPPCPVCDIVSGDGFSPIKALAYGIAVGTALGSMHQATSLVCAKHRLPYIMAMVQATPRTEEAVTADGE